MFTYSNMQPTLVSFSLSLCFLPLQHVRFQFETFRSDATVRDAIINDGDLPEVVTSGINYQLIPKINCENDPDFLFRNIRGKTCLWAAIRVQDDADYGSLVPVIPRDECENDPNFLFRNITGKDCSWAPDRPNNCRKRQPGTGKQVKFFCHMPVSFIMHLLSLSRTSENRGTGISPFFPRRFNA
jgi:hypothetical protein